MFQVKFIGCQIYINKAFHYIKIILIFPKIFYPEHAVLNWSVFRTESIIFSMLLESIPK